MTIGLCAGAPRFQGSYSVTAREITRSPYEKPEDRPDPMDELLATTALQAIDEMMARREPEAKIDEFMQSLDEKVLDQVMTKSFRPFEKLALHLSQGEVAASLHNEMGWRRRAVNRLPESVNIEFDIDTDNPAFQKRNFFNRKAYELPVYVNVSLKDGEGEEQRFEQVVARKLPNEDPEKHKPYWGFFKEPFEVFCHRAVKAARRLAKAHKAQ